MKKIKLPKSVAAAYTQFHSARLDKLEEYVKKQKAKMIKSGCNDSGPVEWECIYRGMEILPGFSEKEVYLEGWNAALKEKLKETS